MNKRHVLCLHISGIQTDRKVVYIIGLHIDTVIHVIIEWRINLTQIIIGLLYGFSNMLLPGENHTAISSAKGKNLQSFYLFILLRFVTFILVSSNFFIFQICTPLDKKYGI